MSVCLSGALRAINKVSLSSQPAAHRRTNPAIGSRSIRTGLLRPGRHEGDLRHGMLHSDEYRAEHCPQRLAQFVLLCFISIIIGGLCLPRMWFDHHSGVSVQRGSCRRRRGASCCCRCVRAGRERGLQRRRHPVAARQPAGA